MYQERVARLCLTTEMKAAVNALHVRVRNFHPAHFIITALSPHDPRLPVRKQDSHAFPAEVHTRDGRQPFLSVLSPLLNRCVHVFTEDVRHPGKVRIAGCAVGFECVVQ
jgi:hypothetical protein